LIIKLQLESLKVRNHFGDIGMNGGGDNIKVDFMAKSCTVVDRILN
jgi:hypothetical protein